jgi:excisionase family DNA binding protein
MTTHNKQNERLLKFLQASSETQAEIDRILEGKAEAKAESTTGPLLFGMSRAAKFLGVSRATLWRMIKARRLGKVEVLPGSFRVRRADLEALVAGKVPTFTKTTSDQNEDAS